MPPDPVQLPDEIEIADAVYRVVRAEPDEGNKADCDFRSQCITIAPWLQGEDTVWAFMHELTHAMVYAAGQHAENTRNEDYVTTLGYLLYNIARENPALVEYLVDPVHAPIPASVAFGRIERAVRVVPEPVASPVEAAPEAEADAETPELSPEQAFYSETTIELTEGVAPHMLARDLLNGALYCGTMLHRSPRHADRYDPKIFPVSGTFIAVLRHNPEVVRVLSEPTVRVVPLQVVQEPEAGGLTLA